MLAVPRSSIAEAPFREEGEPMSKKKRTALITLGVLVVITAGAYVLRNQLVRSAVESASERSLGVPTAIARMQVDLLGQSLALSGYRVSNPEGYGDDPFFRIGKGSVEVQGGTVLSDRIRVPQLRLEGVELSLRQRGTDANYRTVLDHVRSMRTQGTPTEDPTIVDVDEVVIRDLVLAAHLELPGTDPIDERVTIDELRLTGVSTGEGVPLDQLIARVVQATIDRALEQGAAELPEQLASNLGARLDELPDLEALERSATEKAKEAVGDAVGDLLGEDDESGGGGR